MRIEIRQTTTMKTKTTTTKTTTMKTTTKKITTTKIFKKFIHFGIDRLHARKSV